MDVNRNGLRRTIPEAVKRQVRQECFFGCVICGVIPYDYDHFDPEFVDASEHDARGIVLLCPTHHRAKGTSLSRDRVRSARTEPHNMRHPGSWSTALGSGTNQLNLGSIGLIGESSIVLGNKIIVGLHPPRLGEDDWSLSGNLRDPNGQTALTFERNEVRVSTGTWDVENVAGLLTVRSGPGDIVARLGIDANKGFVALNELNMGLGGGWAFRISEEDGVVVTGPDGSETSMSDFSIQGSLVPIYLELNGANFLDEPGHEFMPPDSLFAPCPMFWFSPSFSPPPQFEWRSGDEVWSCFRGGRRQDVPARLGIVRGLTDTHLLVQIDESRSCSIPKSYYFPTPKHALPFCTGSNAPLAPRGTPST